MEDLLETARLILAHDTETIEPAVLATLDQLAADARDRGDDGAEILRDALDALDGADTIDDELLFADVAYVGALVLVGSAS